ncbi:hypothetical protein [Duganella levis]|uniref:Uncharacterized protein n=1 Tax=Duganella levis TaxID=2692169 RepID=A0ABW9W6F3_9BURK|nr:hypothetical protein [Duganella levis]MYN29647.1 hypothetical protein [Duganella levis]
MDSRRSKQAEALATLGVEERARLEHLAGVAQLTPEEMWPEVWQYGFDDVEDSIQAGLDADEDVRAGRTVPHDEVMAKALAVLEARVRSKAG